MIFIGPPRNSAFPFAPINTMHSLYAIEHLSQRQFFFELESLLLDANANG
jgi:hypothetical protein